MPWFIAVVLIFLWASPSKASEVDGYFSGSELLRRCVSMSDACLGYLMGAMDYNNAVVNSTHRQLLCIPQGVTPRQFSMLVVRYLQAHPEELHFGAATTLIAIIKETFPCPK